VAGSFSPDAIELQANEPIGFRRVEIENSIKIKEIVRTAPLPP
jgi:hypothetical protein